MLTTVRTEIFSFTEIRHRLSRVKNRNGKGFSATLKPAFLSALDINNGSSPYHLRNADEIVFYIWPYFLNQTLLAFDIKQTPRRSDEKIKTSFQETTQKEKKNR